VRSRADVKCAIFLTCFLFACAHRDHTITQGVRDQAEWTRQLEVAVPVGISVDSAQATMERNGFECHHGVDSVAYLWCDKSTNAGNLVRERWQAVINLDHGQVYERRAFFGLIAP
jgi:ketosteroid isomerase-like protein